ncbi:exported hypothetical protein [Desulfamplus magnetovallimortis]|uniref:Lcl C-terminal domain-containing protein n=1 Tax=Desulfamplus magnetovallimortis TaxID=1246637 RepID=A0A1W1HG32_9BACT|nr:DUF1566 domain-containing protein [Desulfamplus magnetovallimortis]SLM31434.1 exported hypothetical protein [Desulfamplus magnetovallimortis]
MNGIKIFLCVSLSILCLIIATFAHSAGTYINNGDGTVTDQDTGLMWQQADDGVERNWYIACEACEELELAGYDDWRLPRVDELRTLVDYSLYEPSMNPVFDVISRAYWSGTTHAGSSLLAWYVSFYGGKVEQSAKGNDFYLRCVRSGPYWSLDTNDSLIIINEDVVEDIRTGLQWQRQDDSVERTWSDACKYCEELVLGGYYDWRIPEIEELVSIIDYTEYSPSINEDVLESAESYWEVSSFWYWSNTKVASDIYNLWGVGFGRGDVDVDYHTSTNPVRCVRTGASGTDTQLLSSVKCKVVSSKGSEPVANATIKLFSGGELVAEGQTLSSGYFDFETLSAGVYTAEVSAPNYTATTVAPFNLSAGESRFLKVAIAANAPEIREPVTVTPSTIEAGAGQEVTFLVNVYDPDGAGDIESVVLKHDLLDSILGSDGVEMSIVETAFSDNPDIATYQYKTTLLSGLSPQNYIIDVVARDRSGFKAVHTINNFSVMQKRRASIENKESFSEKVQNALEKQTLEIYFNVGQGLFGSASSTSIKSFRSSKSLNSNLSSLKADTPVTPGAEKCGDCYVEVMIYRPDKSLYNIDPYIVCDSENITIENAESGEWTYETTSHCASSLDVEIETRGADTAVLTGKVKDAESGISVSDARVQWNLGGETFSSENGYFSTVVVAGEGLITTSLANYQTNLKAKVLLGSGETKKIQLFVAPVESSCIEAPDKPIVEEIVSPMIEPDASCQQFAVGVVDSNLVFSALFPPYDEKVNIYLGMTTDAPELSSYLLLFDSENTFAPMTGTPVAWREVKETCQWQQDGEFLSIPLDLMPKGKYTFYSLVTAEPDGMPTFEIRFFTLDLSSTD